LSEGAVVGAAEGEGGCSTPDGGATDIVEEASCNRESTEDAPDGVAANGNTDSSNTKCREMISHRERMSRHLQPFGGSHGTEVRVT